MVKQMVDAMRPGDVLMLENTRFHPEEEDNDSEFSRKLAALGDLYVNDAFGTCHRAHASTEGVARLLPKAAAGFLVQKELEAFGKALSDPDRPFVAVLGGAKISDKIPVIRNLLDKVDTLIIGGGMAYTFLRAKGYEVGKSLLDAEKVGLAGELMKAAEQAGVRLLLPTDALIADRDAPDAETAVVPVERIPADKMGMDIGPATAQAFGDVIRGAGTVIWNGPMGRFEYDIFATGTRKVAEAMADCKGTTIVGGGDSIAALEKMGLADRMTHISTGGGASLELLEGKQLPGVVALTDKA
jgi:phosphoglycerate kinase